MLVVLCAPVARGATSVSRIPCLVPLVACGHPPRGFWRSLGEMGQKFLLTFRSFLLHWGCVVLLPFDSCPPGVAALNRRASFLYTTGTVAARRRTCTMYDVRCTMYDVRCTIAKFARNAPIAWRRPCTMTHRHHPASEPCGRKLRFCPTCLTLS